MIHLVTYATHSEGMFEDLVNNRLGEEITVLGWGTKWTGFRDKLDTMLAFLKTLPPDDIAVFIDGFDSVLLKTKDEIEARFLAIPGGECRVLLSMDVRNGKGIVAKRIFGECRDGTVANSGLYMGYVENLVQVISATLDLKCKDDQVNLNKMCEKFDFIKIDTEKLIFYNSHRKNTPIESDGGDKACIVQYPGTRNFSRLKRALLKEYPQFFVKEIVLVLVALMYAFPQKRAYIFILFAGWALFWDKSCF